VTLETVGEEWLRYGERDRKLRPSTVQDYRAELRHLYEEFGRDTPIAAITTERVEEWRRRLVAEGRLSARTINKRRDQLGFIFTFAQRRYGLAASPMVNVDRQPERRSGDFDVLEPGEVELLAANAATEQDAVIFTVAAFTGLRLGELLALRWGDIDWSLRLIHVRRSFTRGTEGPPKSGLVRSVPLVDQAAAALDRLSRRERWTGDEDLVFVNAVGEYLERSTLRRRYVAALKRAGLRQIRFHDLRHTFGTLAVQAFPLTDVKAFMGHANIATTMRYVHHVPQHDAADRLTALLRSRTEASVGCTTGAPRDDRESAERPETAQQQRIRGLRTRARTWRPRTSSPGTKAGRRSSSGARSRRPRDRRRTPSSARRPGDRSGTPEW
jgi:integrase